MGMNKVERAAEPGDRMRLLRKRRGMTQTKLGIMAGVRQPAISRFENGPSGTGLGWGRACRIAKVLGVQPQDLLEVVE